ncbi:hypothetical protein QWY97_07865 [Vibrio cortegadensis]|uniref:hypothetical protein n=1 Tax=Vibrio cortegadensis TaxID=1328770 RepID=UPI0021C25834|nr:hypothetical protein [Vibrio cortegadensis]MDN3697270.1 hypothetical protein [Vibrio cortegadensis]
MKELLFSTEIKRFVWLQVALNIVFNNIGIVAGGPLIPLSKGIAGTVMLDFILTNCFLIFFLFICGRMELQKWLVKHDFEGKKYNAKEHGKLLKFMTCHPMMAFGKLWLGLSLCVSIPLFIALTVIYGDAIPQAHMLLVKTTYAISFAMFVSRIGATVGSIDPTTVPGGYIPTPKSKKPARA